MRELLEAKRLQEIIAGEFNAYEDELDKINQMKSIINKGSPY